MDTCIKKAPERKIWNWIAAGMAVLLLLILGGAFFAFRVNQFDLSIQLEGDPEIDLAYGEAYVEPGVKAFLKGTHFLTEGMTPEDISVQISGEVNEKETGKYVLTYSADYRGCTASSQRTVRVIDMESPVITLHESGEAYLPGSVYEEEGFTATDNVDGDITHRVIRTELFGKIQYAVLDSSGNPAYAEREVPEYDPIPPEVTLAGGEYIAINTGTAFADPGFSARDNVDGDLTSAVTLEGAVDCYRPGTYYITYGVTDAYQNQTIITRTVDVIAQPRPEITLPENKTIYLTFDDGPGPYTEYLLDVLDKYDVKATFFVIDTGHDAMMQEIVDRGHSIGIHSVTHDYDEIYASPEAFFADLYQMQSVIYENTGVKTTLMRFPGGSSNTVSCETYEGLMTLLSEAVQDAGFQYFDWNVDSNDAGGAKSAKTVFRNVTAGISKQEHSIVLQHDIAPFSVEAVERIILWGLENGYSFQSLRPDSPPCHHPIAN